MRCFAPLFIVLLVALLVNPQTQKNEHQQQVNAANTRSDSAIETERREAEKREDKAYREERDAKDDTFKTQQAEQNEVIKNATGSMATYALASLILAGAIVLLTFLQWRQTGRLFEMSERPSLGIQGDVLVEENANGSFEVSLTLKNSGRTPAVNVTTSTSRLLKAGHVPWDVCPEPYEGDLVEPDAVASSGVLPINGEVYVSCAPIPPDKYALIKQDNMALWVWVNVTYCKKKGQEKPYTLEYYARLNLIDPALAHTRICQNHNDAT